MTHLTTIDNDALSSICDYLSPCAVARLVKTCKVMYNRLVLQGGVKRLCYDWLDDPLRGALFEAFDLKVDCNCPRRGGVSQCACMLRVITHFRGLETLVVNPAQASRMCSIRAGLSLPSLKSLTIVVNDAFTHWLRQSDNCMPSLAAFAPNLEQLVFVEERCLRFKTRSAIPYYDFTDERATKFCHFERFIESIPASVQELVTPPLIINAHDAKHVARCATNMLIKWRSTTHTLVDHFGALQALKVSITKKSVQSFFSALDHGGKRGSLSSLRTLDVRFSISNTFVDNGDAVHDKHDYWKMSRLWPSCLPRSLEDLRMHDPPVFDVVHLPPLLHTLKIKYLPIHAPDDALNITGWAPQYLTTLITRLVSLDAVDQLPTSITRLGVGGGSRHTPSPTDVLHPLPKTCSVQHLSLFGSADELCLMEAPWPLALTSLSLKSEHQRTPLAILRIIPASLTSLAAEFDITTASVDWKMSFSHLPHTLKRLRIWNEEVHHSLFLALRDSRLESLVFDPCRFETKRRALKCDIPPYMSVWHTLPNSLVELVCPLKFVLFVEPARPLARLQRLIVPMCELTRPQTVFVCTNAPNLRTAVVASVLRDDRNAIADTICDLPLLSLRTLA